MAVTVNIPIENAVTDGSLNPVTSNAVHDALELKVDITSLPSNLTLYPTSVASDIVGYSKMVTNINDPDYDSPAVDFVTAAITGAAQLLGSLATTAGILTGNPGILPNVTTIGNIKRNSGTGTAEFYFEVYHRDSGGVETLIGTSSVTSPVSNATYEEFNASLVWNNGDFDPTDRIVIKWYANRIAGGSNPVYAFQLGGSIPVRTVVPVPASVLLDVPIQIGVTEVVDGTSGRVLYDNAGVIGEKVIDTTPANNANNLITSKAVFDGLAAKQATLVSGTNIKTINSTTLLGSGDIVTSHLGNSDLTSTANTRKFILNGSTISNTFEVWNGVEAVFSIGGNGKVGIGVSGVLPTSQMLSVLAKIASDTAIRATHSATTGNNIGIWSRVIGIGASTNTALNVDASGASSNYSITIAAGDVNITATAGVKFGIANIQKLSFWGKTPIVQPTTAITGATLVGGGGTTITATDKFGGYTLQQITAALVNVGILA